MSRSTAIASAPSSAARGDNANYSRPSDLVQFCLPGATKDETQKLAYVNSICIFILTVGFIGIKAPQLVNKEPPQQIDLAPVVFVPEQKPPEPEPLPPDAEPPPEAPVDMPQIATVVAADPSQVKFAIPVEGPVVFAPAKYAQAPPANPPKASPPQPTKFVPNKSDGGYYPHPSYPRLALEQRVQGTVVLLISVDAAGMPASVEIKDSSGAGVLDRHAQQWVKSKWRFPPGQNRLFFWECEFRLQ